MVEMVATTKNRIKGNPKGVKVKSNWPEIIDLIAQRTNKITTKKVKTSIFGVSKNSVVKVPNKKRVERIILKVAIWVAVLIVRSMYIITLSFLR